MSTLSPSPKSEVRVLIIRDRESSGGGIYNYYQAIAPHLKVQYRFAGVGKPHKFYGGRANFLATFTPWRLLCDWGAVLWRIIRFRPHLVHVNPGLDARSRRSLRRDAVNVMIARLFRRPVLVFWRGWDNAWCGMPEFPGGNTGWMCRVYKRAAAHVVLAERFKEDLIRWGFKAPVYVETTVASDECLSADTTREERDKERTQILFLSRVGEAKGVFELLRVFQILKGRNPAFTLTIAGDGPDLAELKRRADEMELSDVAFPGMVTGSDKVEHYRKASIFCFLSYTEGMPNAVLEAMGMGLPVVASDAGGLRDFLRDGQTGFVVQALENAETRNRFDPYEVARSIDQLAGDKALYDHVSAHNTRYARERFSASKVAERLTGIYVSVLSQTMK